MRQCDIKNLISSILRFSIAHIKGFHPAEEFNSVNYAKGSSFANFCQRLLGCGNKF